MFTFIASIMIAMGVSGLCSLMEAVLLSLTPADVAELAKKYPKTGEIWTQFKRNIEKPIAVILILNTTAHTIGAAVAGASFSALFGGKWIWLFSLLFTFLMLQYTEILPKTMGVRFNRRLARLFARPLFYSISIFSPLIRLIHFLNSPFEAKGSRTEPRSTVDEIILMEVLAHRHHLIGEQQEKIILGATKLSRMKVRSVMLPIDETVFLSSDMSLLEAIEVAHMDAHTRFPVCRGTDKNDILGYVNFKEIVGHLRLNPNAQTFQEIIRPISFIDSKTSASEVLRLFMQRHEHIAIVRDENKIGVGIVTLEDVVEELVGEIEDEFDRLPKNIHVLSKNVLLLGGGCPIKTVFETIEHNFGICLKGADKNKETTAPAVPSEEEKGKRQAVEETKTPVVEQKTLASWLAERSQFPLSRGDQVVYNGVLFSVRRMRRQRVFDVQVQKINGSALS